jgi:hypothetical protein
MPEPPLDPELTALGAALGGLSPAPPELDRDRLLYEAGRRSVRPPRAFGWPLAAGAFAALSAVLGLRLATAPAPPGERLVVHVPVPAPAPAPGANAPDSPGSSEPAPRTDVLAAEPRPTEAPYLWLRGQVLRLGPDGLPALPPAGPEPFRAPDRLRGPADPGSSPRWFPPIS